MNYYWNAPLFLNSWHFRTDHLSGASVESDSDTLVVEVIDYYPFGSVRIDEKYTAYENDYKFTGYELDESGLNYAGARYYDAVSGRFTGKDRIVMLIGDSSFDEALKRNGGNSDISDFLSNPQNLNYYSYVGNNPLKYVDPTGNLKVRKKGASKEQIEAFNKALNQLQDDVKNSQGIQDYFNLFKVDINEVLSNPRKGPEVFVNGQSYIDRKNYVGDRRKFGTYDAWRNDIHLGDLSYDSGQINETLIHELGHWANDVGRKGWGDIFPKSAVYLNPDISSFGEIETERSNNSRLDKAIEKDRDIYGYAAEIILY